MRGSRMPQMTVRDFSCIKHANFELSPVTVIIGPQASGKSLLSKLLYFFADSILTQYGFAERGVSFKPYLKELAKDFKAKFPPNAWGSGIFNINYTAGPISFDITRKRIANKLSTDVEVKVSAFYEKQYTAYFTSINRLKKRNKDDDYFISQAYSPERWDMNISAMRALLETLKSEYVEAQLFVPAGRSFYTNLGKAVAMFEFGSQLDEVTKSFGRRFTALLDNTPAYYLPERTPARTKDYLRSQRGNLETLLQGKLKLGSNEKYLEMKDGRLVPFSMMSSGQQELLPLLLALEEYAGRNAMDKDPGVDLLYIEEPEAHLFPAAQSALVKHIASVANFIKDRSRFFITTHSPYVLSTMNNLVKAFMVASHSDAKSSLVSKVIPKQNWIPPGALNAYALDNGQLRSIKDVSGLIDGTYLDKISDDISSEFFRLLELEIADD
jgi:hypothetical protein